MKYFTEKYLPIMFLIFTKKGQTFWKSLFRWVRFPLPFLLSSLPSLLSEMLLFFFSPSPYSLACWKKDRKDSQTLTENCCSFKPTEKYRINFKCETTWKTKLLFLCLSTWNMGGKATCRSTLKSWMPLLLSSCTGGTIGLAQLMKKQLRHHAQKGTVGGAMFLA